MSNFSLETLAEGIRDRHMGQEGTRLVEKWSRTGLLRGLENTNRENMARLLENQTAELLRESSSLGTGGGALAASGDMRGFSNIAFPIVRRVFGGLVANDLVSIQPMSLPSGLLFYLDYTYGSDVGLDASNNVYNAGDSIYNNPTGKGIQSGSLAVGGQYDLAGTGFSMVHSGSATVLGASAVNGSYDVDGSWVADVRVTSANLTQNMGLLGHDPQLQAAISDGLIEVEFLILDNSAITAAIAGADVSQFKQLAVYAGGLSRVTAWAAAYQGGTNQVALRRLTRRGAWASSAWSDDAVNGASSLFVIRVSADNCAPSDSMDMSAVKSDSLDVGSSDASALTIPSFESDFANSPSPVIPEIDIKVESIAVTATTRKLRARWSPELAQDLNAYHSMDAEVELTQILSEQIALEIDREILNDLLTQANGANLHWSRAPGKFVNKETGAEAKLSDSLASGPRFTGTVREWYETLTETIIDCANTIHRKTLRGSANFIVVGPDVATILEASVAYRPSYSLDGDGQVKPGFSLGAEKVGSLSNRFTVYKDPYFPRNKILVGYKGGSYLETGYVYAPYVPLIVTPTIFQPDDFTPRKGVMTRYGKKMVRSDFYGTVTVLDLNII